VQNHSIEIADLLKQLYPIETEDSIKSPSLHIQQEVKNKLVHIAQQSPEGRTVVIEALINVIKDPIAKNEWPRATRWIIAVDLLGSLRANEAIDVLISNLNHTGETVIVSSLHFQPVVGALYNIGKPAISGLIQALGNDDEEICMHAANTLYQIGEPAKSSLIDALSGNLSSVKGGAALVLAWMGGKDAKEAIQNAIKVEKDEEIRRKLNEALTDFNSRWKDKY
jgi:HEAT repeat protein